MLQAGMSRFENPARKLRHDLRKRVGLADANALLSSLGDETRRLASLGPLLGLAAVAHGELTCATYTRQYGHRAAHEFEVALPHPAEDPAWIEQQLSALAQAPVDVTA